MELTSWRGMQIDHPHQWELMRAAGYGEPGVCVFADRAYQRLEVRWRRLTYVPDLRKMLEKSLSKSQDDMKVSDLPTAPPPWRGIVRSTPDGTVVHAGRFFKSSRLLAEAAIVWPGARDVELEKAILDGIRPAEPANSRCLWQAGGMSLSIERPYELVESSTEVGHTKWRFATGRKSKAGVTVERIALVEYWLDGSPGDWLEEQLPKSHRLLRRDSPKYNGHPAHRLTSVAKSGPLGSLLGRRKVRLDIAWRCPAEGRVYHISWSENSHIEQTEAPGRLKVNCCRDAPQVAGAGEGP